MSDQAGADQPEKPTLADEAVTSLPDGLTFNIRLDAQIEVTATGNTNDALKATAAAAVQESDRASQSQSQSENKDLVERTRVDSAQNSTEHVPQVDSEHRPPRSGRNTPLRVKTSPTQEEVKAPTKDSIVNSPTLRKHAIPIEEGTANTLPVVQPTSPTKDVTTSSPNAQSLPSFRQLTGQLGQLTELAEAATQQDPRMPPASHHHSHSFGSATSQSPMMPLFPSYSNSAQTSPTTYHNYGPRSPTSAISEGQHYGSPRQYQPAAYYTDRRRSSAITDVGPPFPPTVPSLPTNSSSGESHGHTSSGTEGYSTSHTTPIDGPLPTDGMQRPILPPPVGMSVVPAGGFKCDYPGCTAIPFQTQYLLSSHRNVHSQNRPHCCPVKDCGKTFKRKNEMLRHGLVHNSPGYICPFCPDREHRYPRPDNLQRHVRVHHVDKDRDDPALREVLAQRQEGAGKQRRRRTQPSIPQP